MREMSGGMVCTANTRNGDNLSDEGISGRVSCLPRWRYVDIGIATDVARWAIRVSEILILKLVLCLKFAT